MHKQPFPPPLLEEFIKHRFWALHEAAFALTVWPKYGLYPVHFSPLPEDVKQDRSFFYSTASDAAFNPADYGKTYQRMFLALKESIEKQELLARFEAIVEGAPYLLSPQNVLIWALLRGMILSSELQRVLGIRQIETKMTVPVKKKVRKQTLAQFYLCLDPTFTREELCEKVKNLDCGREKPTEDLTAIRKIINELFPTKGKGGRPSLQKRKAEKYTPSLLPEVMTVMSDGVAAYHFPLLKEVIFIAAATVINQVGAEAFATQFPNILVNNQVVAMYLHGAPEFIRHMIEVFGMQQLANFSVILFQSDIAKCFIKKPNRQLFIKNGKIEWPESDI